MQYKIVNNIFKYSTTILINYCFLISGTVLVYSVYYGGRRCIGMLFIYDAQKSPNYICRKEENNIYILCIFIVFLSRSILHITSLCYHYCFEILCTVTKADIK